MSPPIGILSYISIFLFSLFVKRLAFSWLQVEMKDLGEIYKIRMGRREGDDWEGWLLEEVTTIYLIHLCPHNNNALYRSN